MILNPYKFTIIAGPCILEDCESAVLIARHMSELCDKYNFNYVFKASFEKANRTSIKSFTGNGINHAKNCFYKIRHLGIHITTDFHEVHHAEEFKNYVDIAQIPAFLCRQTNLIRACAHNYNYVNIKKGQFSSAQSMDYAADKVYSNQCGSNKIVMLTERGTTFGYNDLIVDMRSIEIMRECCDYVIFDATHSCQKPGIGMVTGGSKGMSGLLTRSAIVAGAQGIFMEVHPDPTKAFSDSATQLKLKYVEQFIEENILPYIKEGFNHD